MGVEDKTDMSEDYDKFHEIPPFPVKDDPSLLLINEDAPWLRCRKIQTLDEDAPWLHAPWLHAPWLLQIENANAFVSQCGVLVRDNIPITI